MARVPSAAQARVLARIRRHVGVLRLDRNAVGGPGGDRYCDLAGVTVPAPMASALISAHWVTPRFDSLFGESQTWWTREDRDRGIEAK